MPKVSVIVPIYNVEKYLNRCVDSILAQTWSDFELILIDDGSSDRSGVICDEYAQKDGRVRVIHKENGGVSSARNAGLDAAEGELVAFVDSDDYVDERYLEELTAPDGDLIVCRVHKILTDGTQEPHCPSRTGTEEINAVILFTEGFLNTVWGKLFKKEIIEQHHIRFQEDMTYGEDAMFALNYADYCTDVFLIDRPLYYYVKYKANTLTTTVSKNSVVSYHKHSDRIFSFFVNHGVDLAVANSLSRGPKLKMKHAFFTIYENTQMTVKEKYEWYKLFFGLSTFTDNIDWLFAEYPKKIRILLHIKSAAVLLVFEKLAHFKNKLLRRI